MNAETKDYDVINAELEKQIEDQLSDLEDLKLEETKIGDPKKLVDSISQIVWEQFVLQIAGEAGQDFIKDNNNLNLSLSKADHMLDPNTFRDGKLPTHNFENIDKYQQRYEARKDDFVKDEYGNVMMHKTRTGEEVPTLTKGARDIFDKDRPTGSKINKTDFDHTTSGAKILRDDKAVTYLDESELVDFANSKDNLREMPSSWNRSKGDLSNSEWLENENSRGQKPDEIHDITEKDKQKLRNDEKVSTKAFDKAKSAGEKRAIQEGKESIKSEAITSLTYTGRAIAVALLAKLTRTVFQELIRWLSEKDRKAKTFIEHLKKAIKDFINDFKNNVLLAVDVGATVILTQIFGQIVPMIRKALLFLKIGGESIYRVAKYLKDPENINKETSVKVLEIGKIVTISLTSAGAVGLGMGITYALTKFVPTLASIQIPLLGSVASLLGIFFGGLTAGICGAIVLNNIEGKLEGKLLNENVLKQIDVKTNILALQNAQFNYEFEEVEETKHNSYEAIKENMIIATEEIEKKRKSLNEERETENDNKLKRISSLVDDIE